VRLAPLYDIASALPYDTHERKLSYAMKIGGDYRVFLHRNPWSKAARDLGLDQDALVGRADELAAAIPATFAAAVEAPDVVALGRDLPRRLLQLVTERAARCRALLASPTSTIEPAA
jgi:serine/threonine-protein kinase HipA